jgi:hypothetical protein
MVILLSGSTIPVSPSIACEIYTFEPASVYADRGNCVLTWTVTANVTAMMNASVRSRFRDIRRPYLLDVGGGIGSHA